MLASGAVEAAGETVMPPSTSRRALESCSIRALSAALHRLACVNESCCIANELEAFKMTCDAVVCLPVPMEHQSVREQGPRVGEEGEVSLLRCFEYSQCSVLVDAATSLHAVGTDLHQHLDLQ